MIIAGIFVLLGASAVLTTNPELRTLETNVLHQHLHTPNELTLFYRKLLHSNDVNDPNLLHATVGEKDVRDRNVEHKVGISLVSEMNCHRAFERYNCWREVMKQKGTMT
jgi:hypothetical protein